MRKIKFRAWDKENYKMVKVDSIHFPLGKSNFEDIATFDNKECYYKWIFDYELMQYTEIKDVNGREIYEGDIVKIEDYFGEDMIGKIIYNKESASYIFHSGNEESYFQMTLNLMKEHVCYVIGNIYENKDLLGDSYEHKKS